MHAFEKHTCFVLKYCLKLKFDRGTFFNFWSIKLWFVLEFDWIINFLTDDTWSFLGLDKSIFLLSLFWFLFNPSDIFEYLLAYCLHQYFLLRFIFSYFLISLTYNKNKLNFPVLWKRLSSWLCYSIHISFELDVYYITPY